jgi:hypothetical protein
VAETRAGRADSRAQRGDWPLLAETTANDAALAAMALREPNYRRPEGGVRPAWLAGSGPDEGLLDGAPLCDCDGVMDVMHKRHRLLV